MEAMRNIVSLAMGFLRFQIHHALGFKMHHPSFTGNQGHGSGNIAGIDAALDHLTDPFQPLRRYSDFFRFGGRYRRCRER